MKPDREQWVKRWSALFEIPALDQGRQLHRIEVMERNITLPVKAVFIAMTFYSFTRTPWFGLATSISDVVVETVQLFFWFYIFANVFFALILSRLRQLPLAIVQWSVVTSSLVDGLFIAGLALLSGGLDSILFWLFVVLIVRNSFSVPPGVTQLMLNVAISLSYVLVGALDISVISNLNDATLQSLEVTPHEDLGEPFILRLVVLLLTTVGCYGIQMLWERQEMAFAEAREFAVRKNQLQSAGRLAAEFAHQIKNPLAIINNAAFSLQRSLRDGKTDVANQIEIIQEEVARADRVITQIVGYAKLSEGRVEKLEVIGELERAVEEVFPHAVPSEVAVHRRYAAHFPPLLMQRVHLSEIFVNLLKNAREALGQKGNIFIRADCHSDYTVEISIRDDGPGIPPDKIERIFEAYYTTKEKGTGLGLAIVKHNVELYGGRLRVESRLGHGAEFILLFPAKMLIRLDK